MIMSVYFGNQAALCLAHVQHVVKNAKDNTYICNQARVAECGGIFQDNNPQQNMIRIYYINERAIEKNIIPTPQEYRTTRDK